MARKTSIRQELFAKEYVIDLNGTRAAIAAGYSESGAHVTASQLIRNAKVRRIIDKELSRRASKLELTPSKVVEELHRLAFSNIHDYIKINDEGQADVDLSTLTRDQAAAIQEIKVDTTGGTGDGERRQVLRTTFKLADKGANLERLGRHLKLFTDVVKHEGLEGLSDQIAAFRQRKNVNPSGT